VKIHEYQAKMLLPRFGVAVPAGGAAKTPKDAVVTAQGLSANKGGLWVVKAQIHAGGRGKGRFKEEQPADVIARVAKGSTKEPGLGGVRLCKSLDEVHAAAASMLGKTLVTKQTGIQGSVVKTVYIEPGSKIARELYAAMLLDRERSEVLLMVSSEGGMDIEEVAEKRPEAIHKIWIDPTVGLGDWQARQLAFGLGLGASMKSAVKMFKGLYAAYEALDASMLEINPLVVTEDGEVMALDCKMTVDDNALFRQKDVAAMRDIGEEDPAEVEAGEHGLSFVKLDGTIGCLVNGAGLAMATMDIIKVYGGEPANFLDVGGGANAQQVTAAFKIITKDPAVNAILINIFGGIMKCDTIANGVIAAVKEVGLKVPLVVRLQGTNVELGRKILAESGLDIIAADTMADAAEQAVAASKRGA